MEKLPFLSVFEFRETLPEIDVAVTVTPWMGRLSGPGNVARITAVVWAGPVVWRGSPAGVGGHRWRRLTEPARTGWRDSRRRRYTAPLLGGGGACGGRTFFRGLDGSR